MASRYPLTLRQSKYKRLKRGHRDEDEGDTGRRGLDDIFADDDDEDGGEQRTLHRSNFRAQADEFDDFIEEDFPEDEDERIRQLEDAEVARPKERGAGAIVDTSGLDKDALDDMEAIFGNGEDYDWALGMEYEQDEREKDEGAIELKDVFEPSQLKEKMLTDEDNQIRFTDEPERFQLDRKLFKNLQLTADQFREESRWITNLLWPRKEKELSQSLQGPFSRAIGKVLEFFIVDEVEVPYVFQHRKDYLLYTKDSRSRDLDDPDMPTVAEKLLNQDDLWKILELDIKFRSFVEKRNALEKSYENLRSNFEVEDQMIEDMILDAATMEELQDLQDYLHFQYASHMKQLAAANGASQTKRPGSKSTVLDRVREGRAYQFVAAYGITPDQLAKNALRAGKKVAPDDDAKYPMDLADDLTDDHFSTGDAVMNAARQLYAEELFNSPRMRKHFRKSYELNAEISVVRTDKGLRHIHESHPYYDVKYIQNQTVPDLALEPELFLKMIKAEEDRLVDIKVDMPRRFDFRRHLYQEFESENFSDRAEQWRDERKKVLDLAYPKLEKIIAKSLKETIRSYCQDVLLSKVRDEYSRKLDQAPYKPKGMVLGTSPKVLALSNGLGDPARDPVFWAWVEHDGRVLEQGKFGNLSRDETQRDEFAALIEHRRPDVITVSGWSTLSQKLVRDVEDLVRDKDLRGLEYEDDPNDWRTEPLEVVVVNDEVARLYKDSDRAKMEHPTLNPITRYCIALARYMQSPMKEYAALGKDVSSLAFHPSQKLLPGDKVEKYLETAMVDMVNLCGVNINDAMTDTYIANLLPFVSGLGPRKATSVIKAINANGGNVLSRDELVGDPDSGKFPVVGPRVWNNCASFLYIDFDNTSGDSDPLDNTRVHPEDYELGRKMAADALELDEEDVKAEMDENGAGAIVRRLFKNDEQDKVNELVLEEYAEQLESKYQQRKRATLETIRAELQAPYEELRRNFGLLTIPEIFTMFTGETSKSLCEGMIVPINVRVVKDDFAIAKLDCGIEGRLEAHEVTTGPSVKDVLSSGQTTQAKILELNYKDFIAKLSMREDVMKIPYKRPINYGRDGWDYAQEAADKDELREKDSTTGRTQRVVKHPNFKPYNSVQAEEYLGSKPIGEVVIRPSSKGNDHLAVTWKVADNVYQHLDVLEMQKENEFAVGKVLRVGKYTYSDLDELIVLHVKATARKVEELMRHDKFQDKSRNDTGKFITVSAPQVPANNSQRNGSPLTSTPTPTNQPTPSASIRNTPATSGSASKPTRKPVSSAFPCGPSPRATHSRATTTPTPERCVTASSCVSATNSQLWARSGGRMGLDV